MSSRISTLATSLLLGGGIVLFFAASLNFPFYGDDFGAVKALYDLQQSNQLLAQVLSDFSSTWFSGGGNFYRPMVVVSYAIDFLMWGHNAWGWHLTNLLLHSLNTVMVFLITKLMVRKIQARGAWEIALTAAIFFGIRPILGEVVFWISGRGDSMALLGMLVAFYAYLRSDGKWNGWTVMGLGSFAIALGSKEPAATFPAMIGAWHLAFYIASPQQIPFRQWVVEGIKGILPFAMMVAGYLLLRYFLFGSFLQVYPPELVAPIELTNWIWWLGKVSTLQYFVGPQLSNSLWVKAQNYLLAGLIAGGFLLSFRYRVTRLLWWFGIIWFGTVVVVSIQQLYVTPFGEGERLLYLLLFPFGLMALSPLGVFGTQADPTPSVIGNGITLVGAGAIVAVLVISLPWTLGRIEEWGIVGSHINRALVEIPQEVEGVAAGQTRILLLPGTLDGIYFARNAQGPMMSPPFQSQAWQGPIWVYSAERPCQLLNPPSSLPVFDYRCWNVAQQQFEPFDPATYDAANYPFFWLIDPQSVIQE